MNLIISYECSDCSAGNFESNSIWLKSVPLIHSRRSHKAIYMSRSKDLILIRLSEIYFQDLYCFTLPENQKGMICFTIFGNVNLYMMGNPLPPPSPWNPWKLSHHATNYTDSTVLAIFLYTKNLWTYRSPLVASTGRDVDIRPVL